jgi:hypothetical protein
MKKFKEYIGIKRSKFEKLISSDLRFLNKTIVYVYPQDYITDDFVENRIRVIMDSHAKIRKIEEG